MRIFRSPVAASLAALAALSMTAAPALARDRDRWHPRHHDNGIDGGDLLAGLLVIGGIAAIASAASKSGKDDARGEPYEYPDPGAPGDGSYADAPPAPGYEGNAYPGGPRAGASFDGAVDACSAEIERGDRRIGSVDNVRRMGERYSVEGRLQDGRGYACSVDETGQIRSVAVDGHAMI